MEGSMAKLGRAVAGVALIGCFAACSAATTMQAQTVNPEAKLLADFQERVKKYVELHKNMAKQTPPIKETEDPGKIKAAQDALAAKIQAARANARQGEIFTPEIARQFRRLMYPEVKGPDGPETRQALKEDAPGVVPLKVNGRYPDHEPLPTVPPNILLNLPRLPEELEYRIVRTDLILRDVPANLIVDFIRGAIK
jgi:hypothetical protein